MLDHYEHCLHKLFERLPVGDQDIFAEALIYEQRLRENIARTRDYGNNELRQSERAEIIDLLNRFCLRHLSQAFVDLVDDPRPISCLLEDILEIQREMLDLLAKRLK
jgi:predicted metal-dependent HD superfamily phosphohydrolase